MTIWPWQSMLTHRWESIVPVMTRWLLLESRKEGSGIYHRETRRGRGWLSRQLGRKEWKKNKKKNRALPQQQKIASSQATQDCCYRNKENRDPVDHWGELSLKCWAGKILNQNGAQGPKQMGSEKNTALFPFIVVPPALPQENKSIL